MFPVFWPLTPVSSDKHVLTLGAADHLFRRLHRETASYFFLDFCLVVS